jgi:predicted nucleic acid-binding Zn ribbon protein
MNHPLKNQEPVHIKSIVSDVLKKYRHTQNADVFEISEIWESAVGAMIANDSRPWKINGNVLEVHVSNSSWLHHLNFMKNDIVQKLNTQLGQQVIKTIRFSVAHFSNQQQR